jgi:shikimate dehydrogenase
VTTFTEHRTESLESSSRNRVALIGSPVSHSLSPVLHEAAYAELGLDWRYSTFDVHAGDALAAIRAAHDAGYVGLSVTTPLKSEAARAGVASASVAAIGAANTVVFSANETTLHNTDGEGLLDDLRSAFDFEASGSRCGVVGAGATGRAIVHALVAHGAKEILVVNRNAQRAIDAARLAPSIARYAHAGALTGLDLVVFAVPSALVGEGGELAAFSLAIASEISEAQLVVDVNYHPVRSAFLEACWRRGARTRGGLGMLVRQAARQVELFTGEKAPIEKMWSAVRANP